MSKIFFKTFLKQFLLDFFAVGLRKPYVVSTSDEQDHLAISLSSLGSLQLLLDYPARNLLLIELRNEVQSQWIPLQLFPLFNLHLGVDGEAESWGDLWPVGVIKTSFEKLANRREVEEKGFPEKQLDSLGL